MQRAAIAALALGILGAQAAPPEAGTRSGRSGVGFPWFVPAPSQSTAAQMPGGDLLRIWRNDAAREERLERQYWAEIRATEEQRIRDRYRIETIAALQRAMVAAAARQRALAQVPDSAVRTKSQWTLWDNADTPTPPHTTATAAGRETPRIVTHVQRTAEALKAEAATIVAGLDRAVDVITGTPPGRSPRGDSGVVFFLLLLATFLLPSFAVAMLLLGLIHLRNGHRLQGCVFGTVGGCVMALIMASVLDVRAAGSKDVSLETARRIADCQSASVVLSGFVHDTVEEGVLLANVDGAPCDEHGWVLIVTSEKKAPSGEKWRRTAYPVGTRSVPNALGLIRPIPAYADSVESAVAWQIESEGRSQEWWWQRVLRSLQGTA